MKADGRGANQAVGFAQLPTNLTSQVTAESTCGRLAWPVSHTDHGFSAFLFYAHPFPLLQALVFNTLRWFSLELLRLPHDCFNCTENPEMSVTCVFGLSLEE